MNFSFSYAWTESKRKFYKVDVFYSNFININRSEEFEQDLNDIQRKKYTKSSYHYNPKEGTYRILDAHQTSPSTLIFFENSLSSMYPLDSSSSITL